MTATIDLVTAARMLEDAIRNRTYQRDTRLGGAVARYLAWKRLEASARTLVIYEGYLAALCVHLAAQNPDLGDVTAEMLLEAAEQHPVGSYNLIRTTYRDFFNWAEDWENLPRNPARKLPKARRQNMRVYDVFTAAEQAQIIKATEQLPLPWLQRLRALCFIDLGIRKDEGRTLRVRDFDPVAKVVVVTGKGEKERLVPFGDDLWRAFLTFRNRPIPNVKMRDAKGPYLEDRVPLNDDYLFFAVGFNKAGGRVTWTKPDRPMSERGLHSWWADYLIPAAGVRYRSMHMARHTLGTNLSDAGEGLETIQDWLGHADPATSKIYVHNSRSRLQRGRGRLDDYRRAQES